MNNQITVSKKGKIIVSLVFLGAIIITSIITTTAGVVIHSTVAKTQMLTVENERLEEEIQHKTAHTSLNARIDEAGFVRATTVFASALNAPLASR
jgi:hypothetical protein